ncbi:MAG: hypothetical protein GXY87_05865 [Tissierellia bacterium]|nr:hypothetical protein [Tissierellia bacterium]
MKSKTKAIGILLIFTLILASCSQALVGESPIDIELSDAFESIPELKKDEPQQEALIQKEVTDTYEEMLSTEKTRSVLSNFVLGFDDNETSNLRTLAKKIGASLFESNLGSTKISADNLEAIAVYENSDSYGWIVKYDDNKIGIASISHGAKNAQISIIGESKIFPKGISGIKDNDPEMFREKCRELVEKYMPEGTNVRFLCD